MRHLNTIEKVSSDFTFIARGILPLIFTLPDMNALVGFRLPKDGKDDRVNDNLEETTKLDESPETRAMKSASFRVTVKSAGCSPC